VLAFSSF